MLRSLQGEYSQERILFRRRIALRNCKTLDWPAKNWAEALVRRGS